MEMDEERDSVDEPAYIRAVKRLSSVRMGPVIFLHCFV
jgi:hypothetical protein